MEDKSYYLKNRAKIRERNRLWRIQNAIMIQKKRKRYRREVKQGIKRQRKRISVGPSYTFGGFK